MRVSSNSITKDVPEEVLQDLFAFRLDSGMMLVMINPNKQEYLGIWAVPARGAQVKQGKLGNNGADNCLTQQKALAVAKTNWIAYEKHYLLTGLKNMQEVWRNLERHVAEDFSKTLSLSKEQRLVQIKAAYNRVNAISSPDL